MWEKKRKQIMVWLHFWRSLYIPIFFFFSITLGWIYWIRSNPLHLIMVYHLYFMRIQSHTKKTHTHFHGIPIMWIIFQWFSPFLTSPWINAYVRMCVSVCAHSFPLKLLSYFTFRLSIKYDKTVIYWSTEKSIKTWIFHFERV